MLRKIAFILSISIIIIAVLTFVVNAHINDASYPNVSFDNEDAYSLRDGWYYINDKGERIKFTSPYVIPAETGQEYTVYNTIPNIDFKDPCLFIGTTMQKIKVYIEDELIYHTDPALQSEQASMLIIWNDINISNDFKGKTIKVVISANFDEYSGFVNSAYIGSKSAIMFKLIRNNMFTLFEIIVLLIFAAIVIVVHFISRKYSNGNNALLYLALFIIIVGFWIFSESKVMQFFIGDVYFINNISFVSLILFPVPFLLFMCESYPHRPEKFCIPLIFCYIADFIISTALKYSGISDYFETLIFTHILQILTLAIILTVLVYDVFKQKSLEAKTMLASFIILFIFCGLEMFVYYLSIKYVSVFIKIGIMLYMFTLCWNSIYGFRKMVVENQEAKYYKRLERRDLLTDGKNRVAFFEDMHTIFELKNATPDTYLIYLKIMNLSEINARFGYINGDKAITEFYRCICKAFGSSKNCYRISGNKFACLFVETTSKSIDTASKILNNETTKISRILDFDIVIQIGKSRYNLVEQQTFLEISKQADEDLHNMSKINS